MKKRNIKWKKGLTKSSFILTFLILIIIIVVCFFNNSAIASKDYKLIQVNVKNGDSLWKIAEKYDNNKIDIRKLVYQIKKINNIDSQIYPGQVLYVPVH